MTPAEIELVIRRVLNEGVRLQSLVYVVLLGISALGGIVGSFLTAYARRRGENLATKADFDELLRQLRLQTKETEEIKSEIARTSWIHQQRWDFKREVYSQLLAVLEEIRQKTFWLGNSLGSWSPSGTTAHREAVELYGKHMFDRGVLDKLISYRGIAGMILDQKALSALDDLSLQFDEVAHVVLASANIDDAVYRLSSRLVAAVVDATKIAYDLVREAANDDLLVGQAAGSTS
jgi:hypothetical protein